jgi:excisionase family DNA binding protein
MTETINYRVREFCEVFGISRATFYVLVKAGELRTIKIGKSTRIPRSEAERWQRELERRAGIAA